MRHKRRRSGYELQPETKAEEECLQWLVNKLAPAEDMNQWLRRMSAEEKAERVKLMKLQAADLKRRQRERRLKEKARKEAQ